MSSDSPDGIPRVLWSRLPDRHKKLLTLLQDDDGIAKVLLQPVYGMDEDGNATTSQAEVVADMFNIMRLDVKMMAEAVDLEMEVQRMTPEKSAELLQGLVRGDDFGLIDRFNDLEDKRERVMVELTDEATVEDHRQLKQNQLYAQVEPAETDDEQDETEADGESEDAPEIEADGGEESGDDE